MIFVDTGAWYAALIDRDHAHLACRAAIRQFQGRLLTTDYVLDELLTLLRGRGNQRVADEAVAALVQGQTCRVHWIDTADFEAAWQIYSKFDDKQWSFTDCTSYAVMQKLGITEALALDDHFRQFGFVDVKPE